MFITLFNALSNLLIATGMDAIQRVLRKVRKEGAKSFGHSYRRSIDFPALEAGAISE